VRVPCRSVQGRADLARSALVNGHIGVVVAPRGRLLLVVAVTFANGKIRRARSDRRPERLRHLDLAVLTSD